jgi:hypothetical protein
MSTPTQKEKEEKITIARVFRDPIMFTVFLICFFEITCEDKWVVGILTKLIGLYGVGLFMMYSYTYYTQSNRLEHAD